MADMAEYFRKVRFWIQVLAVTVGTVTGAIINDRMGGHWSIWHKFAVRLACLAVAVGIVAIVGIVSHLPAFRRDGISK
jgi:cytochrome bd-type quinol oxidase subunit 1